MKRNGPNFKFTVTDEIVDLRKLDQRDSLKPEISKSSPRVFKNKLQSSKTEIQAADQKLLSNSLHNLASHLTPSEKSSLKQRNVPILQRNTVRKRQANRAASADPRFRKTRSPERKASGSASAATLCSQPMQPKPVRPCSASTPAFKKNLYQQYFPSMSEESHSKSNISEKHISVDKNIIKAKSINHSVEECKTDNNTIRHTLIESIEDDDTRSSHLKNTSRSREDLRPVSSQWCDKTLLPRYSNLLQLSPIKRTKSSWTLPISTSKQAIAPDNNACGHNIESDTYKYDEGTDAASLSAIIIQKQSIIDVVKKHFCLVLYFSVSSCIGILLAALFIWTFLNYIFPLMRPEEQPPIVDTPRSYFIRLFGYMTGITINVLRTVFSQIIRLLYVQHNEIYGVKEQPYETWFQKIFRERIY